MIKEVLVVEGKMDVAAIARSVEVDCIITEGFNLKPKTLSDIEAAYRQRGIIIFTDPDSAGERIRKFLTKRFPQAKHAFLPRDEATAHDGDIGIEFAKPDAIRAALAKIRTANFQPGEIFDSGDMLAFGLSGSTLATERRASLGALLGLGFANAKTFLRRLNHYGVTRSEFLNAVAKLPKSDTSAKEEDSAHV